MEEFYEIIFEYIHMHNNHTLLGNRHVSGMPTAPDFSISPNLWSNSKFVVEIFDGIDNDSGVQKSQYV